MTNRATVYYIPLDNDGAPTSSVPLEAEYDRSRHVWVNEETGFVVRFLGLVEGLDGMFSSLDRNIVLDWLDNDSRT